MRRTRRHSCAWGDASWCIFSSWWDVPSAAHTLLYPLWWAKEGGLESNPSDRCQFLSERVATSRFSFVAWKLLAFPDRTQSYEYSHHLSTFLKRRLGPSSFILIVCSTKRYKHYRLDRDTSPWWHVRSCVWIREPGIILIRVHCSDMVWKGRVPQITVLGFFCTYNLQFMDATRHSSYGPLRILTNYNLARVTCGNLYSSTQYGHFSAPSDKCSLSSYLLTYTILRPHCLNGIDEI